MPSDNKKTKKTPKDAEKLSHQMGDGSEDIVESLYKKNIEVVNRNKTLSLLSKLYEIGILTLEPKDLAKHICQTVQIDLSFEIVGILTLEAKTDSLLPLAFTTSDRVKISLDKQEISLDSLKILGVEARDFFKEAVYQKKESIQNDLEKVWGDLIDATKLKALTSESHIKTTIIYPLAIESRVLGVVMLAINRNYETLNAFEKESIKSFINVIALALEKAYLYRELEDANDQLLELDRQKDELLSIVSHQLATPVSSVKWYLEMLMDGDLGVLTKDQKEHIVTMQGVAVNLSDLVSMILDVSRIQLGRMKIEKQELDLNTFFKEILEIIEPKAKEKGVQLNVKMSSGLPKAMLDKRYTHMTVENLLSNAVKYTPAKGHVDFTVELRGDKLYCAVKDTGCGIPKADQDKIFGKLFRASNVRNEVDGNGFGLYVAKGAIESQGGKIWFESEENKGTKFMIEVPLKS